MMEIDYFSKGEISVEGTRYNDDLIVCPDKIFHNWRRNHSTALSINDFQTIISERPAYLVIGNGQDEMLQIDDFTQTKLKDLGFDIYIAKTRTAIKKYNKVKNQRKTIGVFHLH